ncbi:hypothetical protein [Salibaculum sp.]|uniref:hypothetical protein n=1 Tax=Salibaculum sp. TaxID=2855480 RepID=UPI002B49DE55|nr:hypothetical protein [Salibaculum sp.]HKL68645.1 hypothetical protein [Salibaculum sp.]
MISEKTKVNSIMVRFLSALCLVLAPVLSGALPAHAQGTPAEAEVQLVMVEQAGCAYCRRWDDEIGPIYPKTEVGAVAPLRRIDLHDPVPDDLDLARRLTFTPTFVLVVDGVELNRIEGYPGEDFFWALVERMIADAGLMEPAAEG